MPTEPTKKPVRWIDIADGNAPLPPGRVNVRAEGENPMLRVLKSVEWEQDRGRKGGRWCMVRWHAEQKPEPETGIDCGFSGIHESLPELATRVFHPTES